MAVNGPFCNDTKAWLYRQATCYICALAQTRARFEVHDVQCIHDMSVYTGNSASSWHPQHRGCAKASAFQTTSLQPPLPPTGLTTTRWTTKERCMAACSIEVLYTLPSTEFVFYWFTAMLSCCWLLAPFVVQCRAGALVLVWLTVLCVCDV